MTIVPTPEQRAAIEHPLEPVRIDAGAGTGKTTTLALRIHHLVAELGIAPEQILGLTFTNKASQELADRVREILGDRVAPTQQADVHTYHGFAHRVVAEFGPLVGVERSARIVTPAYARQIFLDLLGRRPLAHHDLTWPPSVVGRAATLARQLGEHLLTPDDVRTWSTRSTAMPEEVAAAREELLAVIDEYDREKRRLGVLDYADLVRLAFTLADEHREVVERIRGRYRAVFLDEYQDTDPGQRRLLQTLFGAGFPVTAVGDADQTIYEWRGASIENFASFPDHFPTEDGRPARTLALTLNRRSGRRILALANAVRDELGSPPERALRPRDDAPDGEVLVGWYGDAVEEATAIADEVRRLHDEEGRAWSDIAILFRKNKDIDLVRNALSLADVPVEVANLGGLLQVPEVADLHAWLRILEDATDGPALARILLGSRFRLGLADLAPLRRWVQRTSRSDEVEEDHDIVPGRSMIEAIDHLDELRTADGSPVRPEAVDALRRFHDLYRRLLQDAQGLSLVELARHILAELGAWDDVEALPPAARLSARLNLYRFLDLAESWSPLEGRPSLRAFLAHLDAVEEEAGENLDAARISGEDAVVLLTVHRAKGLEWPVVIVPAVYERNFPSNSSIYTDPYDKAQFLPFELRLDRDALPPIHPDMPKKDRRDMLRAHDLRGEWRVAYVAVTRAKDVLIVTGAHWYGGVEPNRKAVQPSRLWELAREAATTVLAEPMEEPPERPDSLRQQPPATGPDPTLPAGWDRTLWAAIEDPATIDRIAEEAQVLEPTRRRRDAIQRQLFSLPEPLPADEDQGPAGVAVTGLVTFATCPRRFHWSYVDRLPRRPSPAARRGVEIHRRIELHARGAMAFEEPEPNLYDLDPDADAPPRGADPYRVYLRSRFAERRPILIEAPFDLAVDPLRVRGRIDAVYEDGGAWEVVDFKSGRRPTEIGPARVQLQAYAMAVRDAGLAPTPPDDLTVTFAYLGGELETVSERVDEVWMTEAESTVRGLAARIADGENGPTPSAVCRTCDFLRFCEEGRRWLAEDER